MKPASFAFLQKFLLSKAGLALDPEKAAHLESRLAPLAKRSGRQDVDDLLGQVQGQPLSDLANSVIDALVINETLFFRDRGPFDHFRLLLPELMKRREATRHIRIWSTACSTGQEPYSIAMILDEMARGLAGWRVDIIATDISEAALMKAREGVYNQFEVQRGLPVTHLLRYFRQEGDSWQIAEHLQSRVRFQKFNLVSDCSRFGWFDVVFCRNVLIYLDVAVRGQVLERISRLLPSDGALVLGAAETVIGVSDKFERNARYPTLWSRKPQSPRRESIRLVAGG